MHDRNGIALNPSYTVEVVSTEAGVAALENDWNRLTDCAENPNVFMTYGWFRTWTKGLISEAGSEHLQPYVLSIKQNQAVVGIAPLVRRIVPRFGLRVRKLEFATYHSDHNELVIGMEVRSLTGAVMEHLAGLAGEWDLLDLTDLRDEGDRIAAMETAAVSAGLPHRLFFETIGCPSMPIDAPWSETQKKKHLRFARRAFLGLHERAGEGFRLRVVDRPQLEEGLLERMIAVEAQKQVDGRLSKPFIGSYPEVFRSLFDTLGPHGLIAIIVLEKFDRLVAYRFLYVCGTKLWDYQTAYDREYSSYRRVRF